MREGRCSGCGAAVTAAASSCFHCGTVTADGTAYSERGETSTVDMILEELARAPPGTPPPGVSVADDVLVLEGRYHVGAFIARGAMGEVHAGVDTKLKRPVAIKFLARRFRDEPGALERFVREAEAAAGLDHPNIVPIYSVGEVEGAPYIVMRFIDGEPLSARISREGPLPLEIALQLMCQICDGLARIHSAGFVHRDIKPHNLMLEGNRCIILDFGILRTMDGSGTSAGLLLGTPAYMSPEQAIDPRLADARSDLYSLGVTLFETVTGELPFRAASALDLLFKHRSEVPAAPSSVRPSLPHALDEALGKMLAKSPEDRFQTAADTKAVLEEITRATADAAPHQSRSAPLEGQPDRRRPRRLGRLVWLTTIVLVATAATLLSWWAARPKGDPPAGGPHGTPKPLLLRASPPLGVAERPRGASATSDSPSSNLTTGAVTGRTAAPRPTLPVPPEPGRSVSTAGEAVDSPAARPEAPPPSRRGPSRRPRKRTRRRSASRRGRKRATPPTAPRVASGDASSRLGSPATRKPTLDVESSPPGASVYVDGNPWGTTPLLRTALGAGVHLVRVEKAGHRPYQERVTVQASGSARVMARLERLPGRLHIVVVHQNRGTWATLSIGSQVLGEVRTVTREVAAGEYRIRARREGYHDAVTRVKVEPGRTQSVKLELRRKRGGP